MRPYYEHAGVTIYHADCLEALAELDISPADAVVTDPPYNVGYDYGSGTNDRRTPREYRRWLRARLEASARRIAPLGSLVWFWRPAYVFEGWVPRVLPRGLRVYHCAGWHRREFAGDKYAAGHPAMTWEPIIWAAAVPVGAPAAYHGGKGGTSTRDFQCALHVRHDSGTGEHPCPKVESVVRTVLGWVAPPRGLVIDPFCGSGTVLRAAKDLGVRAIGIDIEERWCELAATRLAQDVLFTPAREEAHRG